MTKERKLAIEMWEGIRDMLSDKTAPGDIVCYKIDFCSIHTLHWLNNCWFCQYIPCCTECPLKSCSSDRDYSSNYDNVKDNRLAKDKRVEACNAIIKALGGEI